LREPEFLTLAEIVTIHSDQIVRYGGEDGIRDMGLLESAAAQPSATFAGKWLHETLWEMAAAYAFHLSQNHPFYDGNKRTALAAALVFLDINGFQVRDSESLLIGIMYRVAKGEMGKRELALEFKNLYKP
jgi:death on curing protein